MANTVPAMSRGFTQFGSRLDRSPNATPVLRMWTRWKKSTMTALASYGVKWATIQALDHWSATVIPAAARMGKANLRSLDI
jgi:hypothetical protein